MALKTNTQFNYRILVLAGGASSYTGALDQPAQVESAWTLCTFRRIARSRTLSAGRVAGLALAAQVTSKSCRTLWAAGTRAEVKVVPGVTRETVSRTSAAGQAVAVTTDALE